MADRKVTIEVTDGDTLNSLMRKIDQANGKFDQLKSKAGAIGGSVAAGKAGATVGLGGDERQGYGVARSAVGTGAAGRDFSKQSQGLGGLVHVYATFAANIFAVGAAFRALKDAMDVSIMTKSMDVLSNSIGINLKSISAEMVKVTQGAVSMKDSMKFTAMATTAGFTAKNIRQLTDAAKGASSALGRDLNDSMDRLFRGVVKMEPELLDELGIMTKANDAYKAYAITVGKSATALSSFEKRQAFLNAVIDETTQKFSATSAALEVNPYTKLTASLQNTATQILNIINSIFGPIAKIFAENSTLLGAAIFGVVGLLLKKAIPALTDYGKAVEQTAKQTNEAFLRNTATMNKQLAQYKALREAQFNKKFEADILPAQNIQSGRLDSLANSVALAFKKGATLAAVEGSKTISEAIDKINVGSVGAKLASVKKAINAAAPGSDVSDLKRREAALLNILSIVKNQDAAYVKLQAEIAKTAALEKTREATIARDSGNLGTQRKIGGAGIDRTNTLSMNRVTRMNEQFGGDAAWAQLWREQSKAADRYAASAKTNGGIVSGAMSAMGRVALVTSGAFKILGSAIVGAFSFLLGAIGVLTTIAFAFDFIAEKTGGYSKVLGQLEESSKATQDSQKTAIVIQREVAAAYNDSFMGAEAYIKLMDKSVNSVQDLNDKLAAQATLIAKYSEETGTWASNIKEWFASLKFGGLRESTSELDKFGDSLEKAVLLLKSKNTDAFTNDGGVSSLLNRIKAAREEVTKTGKSNLLISVQQDLEKATKTDITLNQAKVGLVKDSLATLKEITTEHDKHKSKLEKETEQATKLSTVYGNLVTGFQDAFNKGDKTNMLTILEAMGNPTLISQLEKIPGIGKEAVRALNDATLGGVGKTIKDLGDSATNKKYESLLAKFVQTGRPEDQAAARTAATELLVLLANELNKISSKTMSEAGKNTAKAYLNGIITNVATMNPSSLFKDSNSALATVLTSGTSGVTAAGKAVNAASNAYGSAGNKPKFTAQEQEIKLLQEKEKLQKLILDGVKKEIDLDIKRGRDIDPNKLLQVAAKQREESQAKFEIDQKQIALDSLKAAADGQNNAAFKQFSAQRLRVAEMERDTRNRNNVELEQELALKIRLAELERSGKNEKFELDMAELRLATQAKTFALSKDELEMKALLNAQERVSMQNRQEQERSQASLLANGPSNQAQQEQEKYNIKRAALDLDNEAAIKALEVEQSYARSAQYLAEQTGYLREVSDILSDSFGQFGKVLGSATAALADYADKQQAITEKARKDRKDRPDEIAKIEIQANRDRLKSSMKLYGDMAGAAKGFFKEHTGAYKVLYAAEKAFRAMELALALESFLTKIGFLTAEVGWKVSTTGMMIAADEVQTASSVANSEIRGFASIAAGAAKMYEQLGIFGPIGIAAMLAVLAGFGLSGKGSGGSVVSAADRQEKQGTGTVLGDNTAKSNSIGNSLKILRDNSSSELEYQSKMVDSLRNIDAAMSGLAKLAAQAGLTTGGDVQGLGSSKSFLGFSKSSKTLDDSGIQLNAQTVGQARQGVSASGYADVTSTKSSFFGLFKSSSSSRELTALSESFTRQLTLTIDNMVKGITQAAVVLGQNGSEVEKILNSLNIDFQNISLKDLKGADIQAAIESVFSSIGDKMVTSILPELTAFQRVGEGLFETIVRTASGVEKADSVLRKFGITAIKWTDITNKQGDVASEIIRDSVVASETVNDVLSGVGEIIKSFDGTTDELVSVYEKLRSIRVLMKLIGNDGNNLSAAMIRGAGGLSKFIDGLNLMAEEWATPAQKFASSQRELVTQFNTLGIAIPRSIASFQSLAVTMSQDLTPKGQELYGALISLAPAFNEVIGAIDKALTEVNALTQSSLDTIKLDTLDEQGRYNFWRTRAEELAKGDIFKGLMSPEEVTKQITDSTNAAMNAWNALDTDGKKSLSTYFEKFFKELNDNATKRLSELTDSVVNSTAVKLSPAQEIAKATESGAITIATAFDLGALRISDAIIAATGGISNNGSANNLREFIETQKLQNAEAVQTVVNGNQPAIDELKKTAESLKTSVEMFKESVSKFGTGASEIAETANTPIRVDLTLKQDQLSGQVNM